MGWLIWHTTREQIIKERLELQENEHGKWEVLDSAACAGGWNRVNLWKVCRHLNKKTNITEVYIALDLIHGWNVGKDNEEWGYKDITASMGPGELNCPLRFLGMVPDGGSYETDWRKNVIEYSAKRKIKFHLGQVVKLKYTKIPEVTITRLRPLLGNFMGVTYRVPRRLILVEGGLP